MAIATTATAAATSGDALHLDSLPIVDLRLLSQSEIYALSLCSSFPFDPERCEDVVTPKIDRSVFNESAGSRKQTYSRLRLAPPSSSHSTTLRYRASHLRQSPASIVDTDNNNSEPENGENAQMFPLFEKLFVSDINLGESFPVQVDHSHSLLPHQLLMPLDSPSIEGFSGHKRKRGHIGGEEQFAGRKQSGMGDSSVDVNDNVDGFSSLTEVVLRENLEDRDKGILNRDGVVVDFVALGMVDHPYWEEIRRRTEGLETEEELKGFLGGLKGRWGSSRKKKRIVDASEFGSALPIGWKLLLSVEKKNDRACLCCARYISPCGRQFVSCKEASSYLLTLTGVQDTHPSTSALQNEISNDSLDSLESTRIADIATQDVDREENPSSNTSVPAFASTTSNHEVQVISDAGFLSEEQREEILHCDKCNVTFCKKDEFLHYRSSIHQRNGYKNVVCITNGVIINENKSFNEASKSVHVNDCTVEISADGSSSQERPGSCLPLPSHDETHGGINNAIEKFASIEKPEQNMASESTYSVKQPSNLENFSCKIIDTVDNTSISASMGSELNLQSNISELASSCDKKAHAGDNVPCLIGEYMVDEKCCSEADDIPLCMQDEMQFGISSVIPSWNEKESIPEKSDSEVSTSLFKEFRVQNTSKSSLVALSGLKSNSATDINDDEVCGRKMEVLEFDDIQIDPFTSNHKQDNLEQERLFGIGCRDSSFNNRTHELGSSFNMFRQEMDSNVTRGENMLCSGQNFMIGFGDRNAQSGDFIRDNGSWRTGHEDLFQGCFDADPNPRVQSSSRFHTFDLTSEKAEEGSFGASKNPDIPTGILSSGRNEPVEYSFMGGQSSNSLRGESNIFAHNSTTEQRLVDRSFWLGKDALVPNTADTNQGTLVCVWCRSLFYQEQVQTQPGIQTGVIGSLCPSCSTRIPGQF